MDRNIPKNIPIGLDMFHYAIMSDEITETYEEPVHIPGLMQLLVAPVVNSANLSADDKVYDTADSLSAINVTLGLADIPTEDQAALLGHTVDANGVLIKKETDKAPYVAIGYRRRLSNGKYRYLWLYKGKFRLFEDNADTKGETPTFQTPSITATFVTRDKDNQWEAVVNEGDPGVTVGTLNAWFDTVYETVADTVPPTVTVDPADDSIDVPADSNIEWTFTKSIKVSTINKANFMLLDSNLASVAGTLDYNSDAKIITLKPTTALTASEEYTAIVTTGVKDTAGNALAAPSVTKFIVAE